MSIICSIYKSIIAFRSYLIEKEVAQKVCFKLGLVFLPSRKEACLYFLSCFLGGFYLTYVFACKSRPKVEIRSVYAPTINFLNFPIWLLKLGKIHAGIMFSEKRNLTSLIRDAAGFWENIDNIFMEVALLLPSFPTSWNGHFWSYPSFHLH